MSQRVRVWHMLPAAVRHRLAPALERYRPLYRWVLVRQADVADALAGRSDLPPPALRYRVGASVSARDFIAVGKACAHDIQSALSSVGRDLASFTRILDFGCGCGRTLAHMRGRAPQARWDGTDIDVEAIDWCRRHLTFAGFTLSRELPPIDYAADTFDLIYAVSVFTHLDEDYQFRWLEELRRLARPGATVVVTLHSAKDDRGFCFERSYERGLFPAWYQNAYHSESYVREQFGRYFDVLSYLPKGLNAHQDVVVLEKRHATS